MIGTIVKHTLQLGNLSKSAMSMEEGDFDMEHVLQASCLQQLYCCTENGLAEKSATLKQPEQIQKGL